MQDPADTPPQGEQETAALAAAEPLLAGLAHELRTPLGAILSLAEILRDERFGPLGSDRYREYAADIFRSAHHVLAIVNAMLDRDSLRSGRPVIDPVLSDLGALAAESAAIARPMADAAGVAIVLRQDPGLPRILADQRTVRQMLLNLLANAVRLSARGGQVRITMAATTQGMVVVTVGDDGPGMSQQDIDRVLGAAAGTLASHPAAARGRTSGIGLPLVRALAVANGAELQLVGGAGRGLEARLVFKAQPAAADK